MHILNASMSPRTKQVLSLTVVIGAILVATYQSYYEQYNQFYPAMTRLSRNTQATFLAFFQWLGIVYLITKSIIYFFFGNLRAIETENIIGHFWISVTDVALTVMIFHREPENDPVGFVVLLSGLIAVKVLHWLFSDRIDFMETSPVITWLFRIRMIMVAALLVSIDATMVYYSYKQVINRKFFWLVFACEYGLLLTTSVHTFLRFLLHSIDLSSSSPWENKNMYMMYIKAVTACVRFAIQSGFTYYLAIKVSFPLYQMRPLLGEIRILKNTIKDIIMSKRALKRMKSFPDAKVCDFKDSDTTCIICHEEMVIEIDDPNFQKSSENENETVPKIKKLQGEIKKLPCKHMFHTGCLKSWFLRQQTCPICRSSVLVGRIGTAGRDQNQNLQQLLRNLNNRNRGGGRVEGQMNFRVGQVDLNNVLNAVRDANRNNNTPDITTETNTNQPSSSSANKKLTPNELDQIKRMFNSTTPFDPLNPSSKQINKIQMPTIPIPKIPLNVNELMKFEKSELQSMVGNEEANWAKRLEFLRNVRTMCDATITLMSQYESVIFEGEQSGMIESSSVNTSKLLVNDESEECENTKLPKIDDIIVGSSKNSSNLIGSGDVKSELTQSIKVEENMDKFEKINDDIFKEESVKEEETDENVSENELRRRKILQRYEK